MNVVSLRTLDLERDKRFQESPEKTVMLSSSTLMLTVSPEVSDLHPRRSQCSKATDSESTKQVPEPLSLLDLKEEDDQHEELFLND